MHRPRRGHHHRADSGAIAKASAQVELISAQHAGHRLVDCDASSVGHANAGGNGAVDDTEVDRLFAEWGA